MSYLIIQISVYILTIPIILGFVRYKRLNKPQKVLLWMIFTVAINQFISKYLTNIEGWENNMPFFHLYMIVEFGSLACIYHLILDSSKTSKHILFAAIGFFTFLVVEIISNEGIQRYPTYAHFIESLIILYFSGSFFFKTFQEGTVVNIFNEVGFWIAVGSFTYFSSNCLLFLFSDFLLSLSNASFELIYSVHAFLTILLYIAYTIAIQCKTNHNLS